MAFIKSQACLGYCQGVLQFAIKLIIDYFGIHINETYLHTSVRCSCIATGAGLHVFGSTSVLITIEDCPKILSNSINL